MWSLPLLIAAAAGTAALSGTLGMAGGLVLMGVLSAALPVAEAVALHGATQAVSNGSRSLMLLPHVARRPLVAYALGAALATGLWLWHPLLPPRWLMLGALGLVPLLALALGDRLPLDFARPGHAFAAGLLVAGVQLIAGVAGPLLDLFFLRSPMDRHQVVATKAASQTLSHVLKLGAYSTLVELDPWVALAMGGAAVVGTWAGRQALEGLSETTFRKASRWVVGGIGVYYVCRAAQLVA